MNKFFLCTSLFSTAALFADEAPAAGGGMTQMLLIIAMSIAFFYFILWRPEQKRRKAAEQMRSAMKKGDRVTAMGIVGRLDRIQEQTVVLKMIDGSKIEVLKGAITDVQPAAEEKSDLDTEK
jgi:preprotein translocase subunit YajC